MRLMVDEAHQAGLVLAWPGFVDRVEGWLLLVMLRPLARVLVGREPAERATGGVRH